MGFLTTIKAGKAYRLQQKGHKEEALKLYEEAFAEGLERTIHDILEKSRKAE